MTIISTSAGTRGRSFSAEHEPVSAPPADSTVVLSVIIATYNACSLVEQCLRSIHQNPPSEPYEIIVVDDASIDDTSEIVCSRFPEVRLLRNETNRHYAISNNRAIHVARGKYLFLLNSDTIVLPHALDRMLAFLRTRPDAGAVGSMLLNGDGTLQWSVKTLPNIGSALFGARSIISRIVPGNPYTRQHLMHMGRDLTEPFVAGYISSAAVMMPRKVVDEVGELDSRLSYHVDADYCKRIADAGYSCYYLPTAVIVHLDHKGGTMVSLRRRFRSLVEFHVGSYIYYNKHIQRSPWTLMQGVVVVGLFFRFLASVAAQAVHEVRNSRLLPRAKPSLALADGEADQLKTGRPTELDRAPSRSPQAE
jgi:N-acetylglucosaminyl-diphospho-decaprenol L-rhamnosyltransferase